MIKLQSHTFPRDDLLILKFNACFKKINVQKMEGTLPLLSNDLNPVTGVVELESDDFSFSFSKDKCTLMLPVLATSNIIIIKLSEGNTYFIRRNVTGSETITDTATNIATNTASNTATNTNTNTDTCTNTATNTATNTCTNTTTNVNTMFILERGIERLAKEFKEKVPRKIDLIKTENIYATVTRKV